MLNHISIPCTDLKKSNSFYDAALAALGYVRVYGGERSSGYGNPGDSDEQFAIKQQTSAKAPGPGFHIAFTAPNRKSVDDFYASAIKFGGRDNGAPGLRPHYGPNYYAAFVFDLDGHALEAVCHKKE